MTSSIMFRSAVRSKVWTMLSTKTVSTNLGRAIVCKANFSNITYSGGQASEGQGGYYASGGARAGKNPVTMTTEEAERSKLLAVASDIQNVQETMKELDGLEGLLQQEEEENPGQVSGRTIEIKHKIKKLMTNPDLIETLNHLELNGEPIWGLNQSERALIIAAREKANEC